MAPRFSVVVPVYNRPAEVEELLESLTHQTYRAFDVLIVEDGSTIKCEDVVNTYRDKLDIHYYYKTNEGPGPSRNYGFARAGGDYFVVFDSDCVIPTQYFEVVIKALDEYRWDAWGGPDRAHENFTLLQRAMGYTMSSTLTTGGIRGGKKHVGWFQPRSFNMGISRGVYELTGGFQFDRFAEDIEFSIRMRDAGLKVGLVPEAFVYHKRRTNFKQFYRQVSNFGKGRALVGKRHHGEVKLSHWFPTVFMLGVCILPLVFFVHKTLFLIGVGGLALYFAAIFVHAFVVNRDFSVALLSVPSAFLQLWGYGIGFLLERLKPYSALDNNKP